MSLKTLPEEIQRLCNAFRDELAAEVDVEEIGDTGRFRIALISDRFRGMSHLARQDLVWAIVDRVLTREQFSKVSLILPYLPGDLDAADHGSTST